MSISKDEFKKQVRTEKPVDVCRRHLFSSTAWLFENPQTLKIEGNYDDFRFNVAEVVGMPIANVAIVGSAKLGFSIAPKKYLKDFHAESDIDLVLVNNTLFEETWAQFRRSYYNGYMKAKQMHADEIFRKFITVRSNLKYESTYVRQITLLITQLQKTIELKHRIKNEIKYRIYADWQDVENYHAHGIEMLGKYAEE